jgi:uncharacterized membrane protein YcaP (DUF421 family)
MEFDRNTTALAFVVLIGLGTAVALAMPMSTSTVMMMVLPSLVAYGLVVLYLGVKHGEHRAGGP